MENIVAQMFTKKERFRDFVDTPVVLHIGDLKEENGVLFLPMYMAGLM